MVEDEYFECGHVDSFIIVQSSRLSINGGLV